MIIDIMYLLKLFLGHDKDVQKLTVTFISCLLGDSLSSRHRDIKVTQRTKVFVLMNHSFLWYKRDKKQENRLKG